MKYFFAIAYLIGAFLLIRMSKPDEYFGLALFLGWWLSGMLYYLNREVASSWLEAKIRKSVEGKNVDGYLNASERLKRWAPRLIFISAVFAILDFYATEGYCTSYLSDGAR